MDNYDTLASKSQTFTVEVEHGSNRGIDATDSAGTEKRF